MTAHVILFKVVPVPGDKISLPLYESTESCESLLQVEWQPDLFPQQNIFSLDYGIQVDIMCLTGICIYIVLCVGEQSICFTDFDNRDLLVGVNLRGPQTLNIPSCDPLPKSV